MAWPPNSKASIRRLILRRRSVVNRRRGGAGGGRMCGRGLGPIPSAPWVAERGRGGDAGDRAGRRRRRNSPRPRPRCSGSRNVPPLGGQRQASGSPTDSPPADGARARATPGPSRCRRRPARTGPHLVRHRRPCARARRPWPRLRYGDRRNSRSEACARARPTSPSTDSVDRRRRSRRRRCPRTGSYPRAESRR